MLKVKLGTMNRLSILGLLENKGDSTTLKVLRELREELSFTAEEHEILKFQPAGPGKLIWNEKTPMDKDFEFDGIKEVLIEKVKTQLREMESKGTLILDHLSLYEVLIEGKQELKLEK